MNTFLATGLLDRPWVLLAILLAGALSNWLMKRRQRDEAARRSAGDAPPPLAGRMAERSQREMDLQEALRQLFGGEPPVRATQPPSIPPVSGDAHSSQGRPDEEQFPPERDWTEKAETTFETAPQVRHVASPPPPRVVPSGRTARGFERATILPTRVATSVNTPRRPHARTGARAIALVRDARAVRSAFIASLVFGPPKAFEDSRP